MKLVTTIVVALDQLGPNHRGRTELLATRPRSRATAVGRPGAEGRRRPRPRPAGAVADAATRCASAACARSRGGLLLDRTLFRPARIDVGLPPFDESPELPYNVIPDALMLGGNLMRLALHVGRRATCGRASPPPLEGVEVDAAAMTLSEARLLRLGRRLVAGASSKRCTRRTRYRHRPARRLPAPLRGTGRAAAARPQRRSPSARCARSGRAWAVHGSGPRQRARSRRTERCHAGRKPPSRPWGEVLRGMNKQSDNAHSAAALPAARPGRDGAAMPTRRRSSWRGARSTRWFDERRIDRTGLVLDNGSGLSRSERIAPLTLARMLKAAHAGRQAPELLMSLPVAGVDGTMRRRLKGTPGRGLGAPEDRHAEGRRCAGRLCARHARRHLGRGGVVNHPQAAQGRPALDALVEWVARSGARWR